MGADAKIRSSAVILLVAGLLAATAAEEAETKKLTLYGYVKLDMAYDDSRVNPGNFARWVESESILDDDSQFSMTANQTRAGLKISAPPRDGLTTTARIEIDFYGGGAGENKSNPLLRHAWVQFAWPAKDIRVLAGQGSDIISPLVVPTINYSAGWWQGNIGYRRAQLSVTKGFSLSDKTTLDVTFGPTRTISDSTFVTGPIDSGADAAVPTFQTRTGLEIARAAGKPIAVGLSGHSGEEDQHMTDGSGTIIGHNKVDTWSANVDVSIPVSKTVLLQAEWFHGENLYAFLGGIGQKGDFLATGGWLAATIKPANSRWRASLGGGIDDPRDADLTMPEDRRWNAAFFANTSHSLTPDLTLALELMFLRTRYLGLDDGGAMRVQFAVQYAF